jgi:hypothetical protein
MKKLFFALLLPLLFAVSVTAQVKKPTGKAPVVVSKSAEQLKDSVVTYFQKKVEKTKVKIVVMGEDYAVIWIFGYIQITKAVFANGEVRELEAPKYFDSTNNPVKSEDVISYVPSEWKDK